MPVPRVHGQEAAEDPRERGQSEQQPGVMVPTHPTCVRRRGVVVLEAVLSDRGVPPHAPEQAGCAHHGAKQR